MRRGVLDFGKSALKEKRETGDVQTWTDKGAGGKVGGVLEMRAVGAKITRGKSTAWKGGRRRKRFRRLHQGLCATRMQGLGEGEANIYYFA